jgi:hypothetical protein
MPEQNAGLLFTHFMKGYMDGSAQANAARLEKAKGLMEIAAKQAEIIDTATNPETRAAAHKIMLDIAGQAEKAMRPDPGFFGIIRQAFGKNKDASLQDPHELYTKMGLIDPKAIAPYGTENKVTIGGTPQEQSQGPGVATATAQPPSAPTGETAGQLPTIPVGPLPAPRPPLTVPFPRKATPGAVAPEEATGQGPEKIQLGPDQYDYRIDGVQVSPREYRGYIVRMAEQKSQLNMRGKELEQSSAQALKDRALIQKQEAEFDNQKATALKNSEWYKGEIASGDPYRIKAANDQVAMIQNPGLKTDTPSNKIQEIVLPADPSTGQRKRRFMILGPDGLPTGKLAMPDMDEPPSADEMETLGLLKEGQARNPNYTYQDAVLAKGKLILDDKRTAIKMKQLQLSNAALEQQLNELKLKAAKLQSDPNRTWINGMYEDISKLYLAAVKAEDSGASASEIADTVFKGTVQQLAAYGISFEEFLKVNGRDPAQLKEVIKQQYLKEKQAETGTTSGGKPVTKGIQ